jgi:hypothetical protein
LVEIIVEASVGSQFRFAVGTPFGSDVIPCASEHGIVRRILRRQPAPRTSLVAAQASDDLADVRSIAAAQPKHVGPTGVLPRHDALREARAAAQRKNDQRGANDLLVVRLMSSLL